jgi:hypothetical protein
MAFVPGVNAQNYPTLLDMAKRLDPDGSIATIVELLTQTNEILEDAVVAEANNTTSHRTTVRTDIPIPTWRRLNYGVKPTKSMTAQVDDAIGMLEDYAEVDKDLAMLNGNTASFRMSEDMPHLEGMNQMMAETMFYGDQAVNPDRFTGLSPRYDALAINETKVGGATAQTYGEQVISGGGVGADAQQSIWLVTWGPNTAFLTYPKGSKAGILHEDLGEQTLFDDDGGRFQGFRTHYQWKLGMCVRDWRYIVRVCNLEANGSNFDYKLLIRALHRIPNMGMGRAVFYTTRQMMAEIAIDAAEKANNALKIDETYGKRIVSFWGVPIRQCDSLLLTEAIVT